MIKPVLIITLLFTGFFSGIHGYKAGIFTSTENVWIVQSQKNQIIPELNLTFSEESESWVIPVKRAGNLILLEAIVDSIRGNLILDTGAKGIVLNSIYFRQHNRSGNMMAGGITGSAASSGRTTISSLRISEIVLSNTQADISDLGHIEKARNIKILGLFGLNMFSGFEIILDLKNSVMELHRLDYYGNRLNNKHSTEHDLNLAVSILQDVMFLDALINKRKLIFCLDTGAESNVLSSQLPDKILGTVSVLRRSTLRGVGSRTVEVVYGVMNDFSLEGKQFPGMNTIITNLTAMSDSYNIRIDGMLGCDFFEKGIFSFNLRKKNLSISFYEEDKH